MPLTGQIGTPQSRLANVELAYGAAPMLPGPPAYAGEVETGPPVFGAPWFKRQILIGVEMPSGTPPPPPRPGPPPFVPEVREGPPLRGAPWVLPHWVERLDTKLSAAQIQAMQPPVAYPPETETGPPIQGAPWFKRQAEYPVYPLSQPVQPAAPPKGPTVPEVHGGPPLRGAPWLQQLPLPTQPSPNAPVTPVPRRPTHNVPFLVRVQGADTPDNWRRLDRFTERASSLINSLVAQGIIKQTGPSSWTIVLPSGGGGMGGGGATGTFSGGGF